MTLPSHISEKTPEVSGTAVRAALGQVLHRALKPLVAGLAALYAAYAFGHPVFIGGGTGLVLAAVAGATSLILLGLRLGWDRLPGRVPWPHALGAGVAGLTLINALLHLGLTHEIAQSTNVMLLLLGTGALCLSTPWYAAIVGATLSGWGLTVWATLPHEQLPHYGFAVTSAAVLATVIHLARRRSARNGQRDRLAGEQLRGELARSLRAEAATRRALERSNRSLEKAVNEAEEMNRLQAAFLADMSHEIRTPLTSIIGFAEVLDEEATGEAGRFAHLILDSSHRLLDTVNSVLDLSKLQTESVHLEPKPTDVGDEVRETAQMFRTQADDAGVSLSVTAPDSLEARLDRSALHRCCSNLISNAIKYTEPEGDVNVRARAEDEQVIVEVEDTGVGIPPDHQEALFEPFEQVDQNQNGGGTGLGLAITHRLVSIMGGSIDVESTPGDGSVFTVRVPRWDEPGTGAS